MKNVSKIKNKMKNKMNSITINYCTQFPQESQSVLYINICQSLVETKASMSAAYPKHCLPLLHR